MLVSIGRRRPPTDILDTILGCHARIRAHVGIAKRLAESSAPEHDAVVEAAGRVFRYFSEALPIHTLDEDLNLLPRLLGRSTNLDQVLAQMQRQHREHIEHRQVDEQQGASANGDDQAGHRKQGPRPRLSQRRLQPS
ncbi:MAG: hemerythrin domain-containing protein, partial [Alphaproteobacteria bacterium]|nr:hemerythrin domain-containing protein [Alphaproteobacteria bacterium]